MADHSGCCANSPHSSLESSSSNVSADVVQATTQSPQTQLQQLPPELLMQVVQCLSVADRLALAQVNHQFRGLLLTKKGWKDMKHLHIESMPKETPESNKEAAGLCEGRLRLCLSTSGVRSEGSWLSQASLQSLQTLLPPITHLSFEHSAVHTLCDEAGGDLAQSLRQLFWGGQASLRLALTHLQIDHWQEWPDDAWGYLEFHYNHCRPDAALRKLMPDLINHNQQTLQLITGMGDTDRSKENDLVLKTLTAIGNCGQLNECSLVFWGDTYVVDDDAVHWEGELASCWADRVAELLESKPQLTVMRLALFGKGSGVHEDSVLDLFKLCTGNPSSLPSLHFNLTITGKGPLLQFDPAANKHIIPNPHIQTLRIKLHLPRDASEVFESCPWLDGLLDKCPSLRRLALIGRATNKSALALIGHVIGLVMQLDRGFVFEFMLSYRENDYSHRKDMCGPKGTPRPPPRRMFSRRQVAELCADLGYECKKGAVSVEVNSGRGDMDRYKWMTTIRPSNSQSETRINIYGHYYKK